MYVHEPAVWPNPSSDFKKKTLTQSPVGVLLMAYGGIDSLADVPGYLSNIRAPQVTSKAIISQFQAQYQKMGGQSPLLANTREQAVKLQQALGDGYKCYIGMRYWTPWIEDVVGQMINEGIKDAISIVSAPQFSPLSIAKYHAKIAVGQGLYHKKINFQHIQAYHDEPLLIAAFAENLHQEIVAQRFDLCSADTHIVFSAHSLPQRVLQDKDPYVEQVMETATLIANKLGITGNKWSFSYQSAGRSSIKWLGPSLEEHLSVLATQNIKRVMVLPVCFTTDHAETLHDIDIQAAEHAKSMGIELIRPKALDQNPLFVQLLSTLVSKTIKGGMR